MRDILDEDIVRIMAKGAYQSDSRSHGRPWSMLSVVEMGGRLEAQRYALEALRECGYDICIPH